MKALSFFVCFLCVVTSLFAQLRPAGIFSDNMVLQRDAAITVWGTAAKGADVKVSLGTNTVTVAADKDGRWETILPSLPAGGPLQMSIKCQKEQIVFRNVLIGDVWFASGQSNMEHPIRGWEWIPNSAVYHADKEIRDSNYPMVRLCSIPKCPSPVVAADVQACRWQIAGPQSVAEFAATAWFFGKALNRQLNIPIGIIHCSWGGTAIQTWMSRESLEKFKIVPSETPPTFDAATWPGQRNIVNEQTRRRRTEISFPPTGLDKSITLPEYDDSGWKSTDIKCADNRFSNVVWLRKTINIPECFAKDQYEISLGYLERQANVYFNGTEIGYFAYPEPVRFTVPRSIIVPGANVLTIRLAQPFGYPGAQGDTSLFVMANAGHTRNIPLSSRWKANDRIETITPEVANYQGRSTYLYNGMVAPLTRYKVMGFIWSQGEANAGQPELYAEMFHELIRSWRSVWQQGDLPFLFVQASSYMTVPGQRSTSLVKLREVQAQTVSLSNTGMAVTVDIGDPYDVHYKNKQEVGRRLSLHALSIAYRQSVTADGPVYHSYRTAGDTLVLKFSHTGADLQLKQDAQEHGFFVVGKEGIRPAARVLVRNDELLIVPGKVKQPFEIQYAWEDYPACTLFNSEGLPAAPFSVYVY